MLQRREHEKRFAIQFGGGQCTYRRDKQAHGKNVTQDLREVQKFNERLRLLWLHSIQVCF